jgi:hypothetical protein
MAGAQAIVVVVVVVVCEWREWGDPGENRIRCGGCTMPRRDDLKSKERLLTEGETCEQDM